MTNSKLAFGKISSDDSLHATAVVQNVIVWQHEQGRGGDHFD
jgi:hypothetical protein